MRTHSDSLSVELVLESGQVLPEVTNGGVTYAVATPGEKFWARVRNHSRDAHYRVSLSVDGVGAGYNYCMRAGDSRSCTFEGILVNSVGEDAHMKRFQFQDTTSSGAAAQQAVQVSGAALDSIKVGRINIDVIQVVDTGATKPPPAQTSNQHAAPSGVKLPDGKKWFLAPSLSASNGPAATKKMNWDTTLWQQVGVTQQYTLRYETAATLILRGILRHDHAAQNALIQDSLRQEAERVAAAVVKPEPAAGGSSRLDGGASTSRAQGQAARQQGAGGSGQRAPMVDLSIEKDDSVLCDLTGEAPAWHISKKPKIVID